MRIISYISVLMFTLVLTACSESSSQSSRGIGGEGIIGDYKVKWSRGPRVETPTNDNLTPLAFVFAWTASAGSNGVTQEDWQREADRFGVSTETMRIVLGTTVRKTPDGRLAGCSMSAIEQGLCGRRLALSIDQRATMAQQMVDANAKCSWVGFDPAYNSRVTNMAGAASRTLHVRADCG